MCGIAGVYRQSEAVGARTLHDDVRAMIDPLRHRGPDDSGVWTDPACGIGLGHRRLSILDLSPTGHQPMASASGRYVMAYNGEVYNHAAIRAELAALGHGFRGHSDTEVVLEAFDRWGIEATLPRLNGMFAMAVWDRDERSLTLIRDRMGVKPLYWGRIGGAIAFASELKALRTLPGWSGEIDRDALTAYMRFCYIPAPRTIHRDVHKLEPGCILRIDARGEPSHHRYWDTRRLMAGGTRRPVAMQDGEAIDHLDALLRDAVGLRMVADVPVGAFLSGGIDSSVVVAIMQAVSTRPVHTFSIGFEEEAYNEAGHAAAVARHLGTHHTELIVTERQAMDVIPDLPRWYDEPFADSSQIPTLLVSQLARWDVAVSLSGDGGDELFAGYTRYFAAAKLWQPLLSRSPMLRRLLPATIGALSPRQWDVLAQAIPGRWRPPHFGSRLYKLRDAAGGSGPNHFYLPLLSHWTRPEEVVKGGREPPHPVLDDQDLAEAVPDIIDRMQLIDMLTYLPDDIMTKVDRASMAVSLEAREPLLDYRIVEFACALPLSLRIRDNQGKWLLRQVLGRYVPTALTDRPKMGFGVPIDKWLRGGLRDWAEALLDPTRLAEDGILHPEPIRRMWRQHLDGISNWQYPLWDVLMFQAWREHERAAG